MSRVDTTRLLTLAEKATRGSESDKDAWLNEIDEWGTTLCEELDEARAALDRVRAWHAQTPPGRPPRCVADGRVWPCPTIWAIDSQDGAA